MITDILKETLKNHRKFLTLSLVITLQKKCIDEFLRLGITPQTLSFIVVGLDKISEELNEGKDYIKTIEDFNDIIKGIEDDSK